MSQVELNYQSINTLSNNYIGSIKNTNNNNNNKKQ